MKSKITLFVFLLFAICFSKAQNPGPLVQVGKSDINTPKTPCLTSEQRNSIKQELRGNIK
jgi:hypothetical protein